MPDDLSPGASSQHNSDTTSSSPSNSGDNIILTPRSKIQKLLSAFDDSDSDKENQTVSPRPRHASTQAAQPSHRPFAPPPAPGNSLLATSAAPPATSHKNKALDAIFKDDSESEAEVLPRPSSPQHKEHIRGIAEPNQLESGLARHSPSLPAPGGSQGSALFVSRSKPSMSDEAGHSDSDDQYATTNSRHRLQELVARKRAEREAKEIESEAQNQVDSEQSDGHASDATQKKKKPVKRAAVIVESENSDTDDVAGRKFTQDARPARKASKKAIEEMRRETQRMSRNMQLAHEARTKTKFATADLFKRMGFRQSAPAAQASSSSAAPSSDVEGQAGPVATPPSSPPSLGQTPKKHDMSGVSEATHSIAAPAVQEGTAGLPQTESSTKSKQPLPGSPNLAAHTRVQLPNKASLRQFAKSAKSFGALDDSDDELEIIEPRAARALTVLDNVPEKKSGESKSIHALRALAHLNESSGSVKRLPKSMSAAELRQLIQLRSREQTKAGLEEKRRRALERGEQFLDDETLEKDQVETHDLIEKARKEDQELAKREKEAAKREAKEGGGNPDGLDDSGDEDYEASDEEADGNASASGEDDEDDDEDEVLSGSEDEADSIGDSVNDQDQGAQADTQNADAHAASLIEDVAAENADETSPDAVIEDFIPPKQRRSNARRAVVDSDDETSEEATVPATAELLEITTPAKTPNAALTAAFGFNKSGGSPALGLSQIFGGTMAGSQTQDSQPANGLHSLPVSPLVGGDAFALPPSSTTSPAGPMGTQVEASQLQKTPSRRPHASGRLELASQLDDGPTQTQLSEFPAPTQDAGFEVGPSPVKYPRAQGSLETQDTYSTVDTVPVREETTSPVQQRYGRLRRGRARIEVASSQEDAIAESDGEEVGSGNAFLVMKKASKQPKQSEDFNKKDSKALAMFEEQAEESEDEYAGLGGASDDESGGELDVETRAMIDDAGKEKVNERRVAQRYNEQRLAEDEKQTSKLFRDVTTGAWRRKRGAQDGFFDDDDDEEEAAARRRAAKQREFAKMRKALLADEKIGKIAQNPKREAFLKAIEDFVPEHEMNFLDEPEDDEPSQIAESQTESRPAEDPQGATRPKRGHDDDSGEASNDAAMSYKRARRSGNGTTRDAVPDIRRTLSEMIGEPEPALNEENPLEGEDDFEGSMDEEDADDENRWTKPAAALTPNPRRTNVNAGRQAVIDRMALKRGSTSNASNTSSGERMAFSTLPTGSGGSFKVPSLLRRATTNASNASETGVTSGASMGVGIGKEAVKMGGSKKSSVNYYVREQERRAKVEEMERQRREGHTRIGKMRRDAVGLGSLGGGSFE